METRAYNELYLSHAMENLAVMFEYGINRYGIPASQFFSRFITSGVAEQFGKGNPLYLVGHSGWELADIVLEKSGGNNILQDGDAMIYGRSAEYWAGYVLAFYQWKSGYSFEEMQRNGLDISRVIAMYNPLHEADLEKFAAVAESIFSENASKSNRLKEARENIGLTQKQLAELSGVSLRMIRAYEQKKQDLSRAEYATISRLANVLKVSPDSLVI